MRARAVAIACLAGGAVLLVAGVIGHQWGVTDPGGHVGLLDTIGCGPRRYYASVCGAHGATEPTRIEGEQFARLGQIALIVGVLGAICALAAIHPRLRRPLAVPAAALALGAVAASAAFTITEPFAQFSSGWRPGPAWWLVVAGAALVTAGVRMGPPERPRAWIAWALLAFAAPLLAISARGVAWWRGAENSYDLNAARMGVGPAMVEVCLPDGECWQQRLGDATSYTAADLDGLDGLSAPQASLMGTIADDVVPGARLRTSALIAGRAIAVLASIAAALAAALALATAARRRARSIAFATLGASAALLIAIAVFEASSPGGAVARLGVLHRSIGLPIALAAIAFAAVPAFMLARARDLGPQASGLGQSERAPIANHAPGLLLPEARGPRPEAPIPPCPACGAPLLYVKKRDAWLCTLCKARDSVPT